MKNKLKLIFETSNGTRVERILEPNWSSEAASDLSAFINVDVSEMFKKQIAELISESLTSEFVKDMLDELVSKFESK